MRRWSLQTNTSCRPISQACHKPSGFTVQRQVRSQWLMQPLRGGAGGHSALSGKGVRAVNTCSHRVPVGVDCVVSEIKKLNVSDITHS